MQATLNQTTMPTDVLYNALNARFGEQAQQAKAENTHSLHGELLDTLEEMMAAQRSHLVTMRAMHVTDALLHRLSA